MFAPSFVAALSVVCLSQRHGTTIRSVNIVSCNLWLIVAGLVSAWIPGSLSAQTATTATDPSSTEAVLAAEKLPAKSATDNKLRLQGIRLAPYSLPRAGQVLTLHVSVVNPGTRDQVAQVIARMELASNYAAAAEVSVPAGQTRLAEVHLRLPPNLPPGGSVTVNVSLNALAPGEPILLDDAGRPQIDSLRLVLAANQVMTIALLEPEASTAPEWYWPKEERLWSYEMLIGARIDANLTRQLSFLDSVNLPTQLVQWDQIDSLVIAQDQPLHDAVAVDAIRRWIADGGRAWLMLDRLDPNALQSLLPAGMNCEVLDDVKLKEFVVDAEMASRISEADRTVRVDRPLQMRRVTQTGGRVTHRIEGYPAAIWYTIGKGFLLVTTLEARGWLEQRSRWPSNEIETKSDYQLRVWAQAISDNLFVVEEPVAPIEEAVIQYPQRQIGNPILDRRYALLSVFGFCGLLSLAGGLCWLRGRLALMGWLAPGLAVLAALPTLWAGSRQQQAIPDTSAHFQLIEVLPGSQSVQCSQWTTMYTSRQTYGNLLADGDVMLTWSQTPPPNDLRKTLGIDFQRQALSSTAWPHGLWSLRSQFALPAKTLDVIAELDERGLRLRMPKQLAQKLEDPVVQFVAGDVVPCPQQLVADQTFYLSDEHLTAEQSWLASSIVTDEQSRREELYRQIPARGTKSQFPSYPALMGWTELWQSPLEWSAANSETKSVSQPIERGAALLVLPIRLLPAQTGKTLQIPHSVIRVSSPNVLGNRSSAFSNASGLWRDETTLPATVPVRFEIPPQVGPLEVDEIQCEFKIRAPQRQARFSSAANGAKPVFSLQSPLGAQRLLITDPAILEDARDGVLDFMLEISPPLNLEGEESIVQAGAWQVEYLRISLHGQVLER